MKDFSFQGKIYLGTRLTGGLPGALTWVGDAPACNVAMSTTNEDRTESYSGNRLQSARLRTASNAELTLTLNYFDANTLALGLYATVTSVAAGNATDEVLPSDLAEGDTVALANPGVSSVVITDSTGSPLTLTADTDYVVDSADAGLIRILNLGAYVQPFKASYSYGAAQSAAMFTADPPERYFLLDGINTVSGERVVAHLYRVQFNPSSSIPLINDSFGQLELSGAALFDPEAALDDDLGGFGKFVLPTAA